MLDIGAGAGRACLALQERGHDVLALDTSPAAVRVCRKRGVRDTFTGTVHDLADGRPGPFDTFLLLGNNLGLLGTPQTAPGFLAALTALSSPDARVVGIGTDPYTTQDPIHLRHHERNRSAGRPLDSFGSGCGTGCLPRRGSTISSSHRKSWSVW